MGTTEIAGLQYANTLWVDTSPTTTVEAVASFNQFVVSENVIQTVTTEAVGSGVIKYVACWYPLTPDSTVVAA